ncbi:hypothetical protein QFZ75_000053 [Streptomyces sp. V3I8]|uniref:hypothetical protein n=1 Tax=Streptomyces sp. V3I8 TaxID=3042279 RepID=UPI002788A44D|nr:hypothetical protein [Streptomyces sp. V3I8]MDQ1033637.1 hypothetical protein [Streptomyces sp. V3I8]
MNSTDPTHSPLRDVAASPAATAHYLANVQRVLLDISKNLETLAHETRVHLRDTHVDGDRWYHARLRARPVETALGDVLKSLNSLTEGLEKTAYKRRAHDEKVVNTTRERKAKVLEKERKKHPQIPAAPNYAPQEGGQQAPGAGYSAPGSIYDLGQRRESA